MTKCTCGHERHDHGYHGPQGSIRLLADTSTGIEPLFQTHFIRRTLIMPATPITLFRGTFLSNFWPAIVSYGAGTYPSVENAYVAAKIGAVPPPEGKAPSTPLEQAAVELLTCKPGNAKRIGKRFPMVAGWDGFKLDVMRTLVTQKFAKEPLRSMLLITGDEELVENNSWNDTWWGVCRGVGENNLGKLLMTLRSGLRQDVPK